MELKQKSPIDEALISKVNGINDIVDYKTSSIVSHTVINKNTGTVTFFAFDKGEELSEHTSSFDALVSILDGKAEITISGNSFILESNEMIIMPADKPHALRALDKFKMMLVMIK